MAIERRAVWELRTEGRRLAGIAAPFGTEARINDFVETIAAGAFTATLADGHDIVALVDHDGHKLLGRTRTGSLRLQEARQGLAFEIDVPQTTLGSDVLALAERGDLGGMSFAFRVRPGGEHWSGRRRELRSVDLLEVSVIHSWPAYSATEVHARARSMPWRLCQAQRFLETC
jgi:HK97 family phage prohead protease